MAWLPNGEKNFKDTFIRFGATHERDRQTDRRTDRHRMPAIAALMHGIARQKGEIKGGLHIWQTSGWLPAQLQQRLYEPKSSCTKQRACM